MSRWGLTIPLIGVKTNLITLGLAAGVLGDLRGGAGQLFHGGGDLHHRGRLLGRAGSQLGGDLVDRVGGRGDLDRAVLDLLRELRQRLARRLRDLRQPVADPPEPFVPEGVEISIEGGGMFASQHIETSNAPLVPGAPLIRIRASGPGGTLYVRTHEPRSWLDRVLTA